MKEVRDTEILQAWQQEIVHHFVLAGDRLNKLGAVDVVDEALGIFAHLEEVGFFLASMDLRPQSDISVYELAFREERFAVRTIEALIGALVDVAPGRRASKIFWTSFS